VGVAQAHQRRSGAAFGPRGSGDGRGTSTHTDLHFALDESLPVPRSSMSTFAGRCRWWWQMIISKAALKIKHFPALSILPPPLRATGKEWLTQKVEKRPRARKKSWFKWGGLSGDLAHFLNTSAFLILLLLINTCPDVDFSEAVDHTNPQNMSQEAKNMCTKPSI